MMKEWKKLNEKQLDELFSFMDRRNVSVKEIEHMKAVDTSQTRVINPLTLHGITIKDEQPSKGYYVFNGMVLDSSVVVLALIKLFKSHKETKLIFDFGRAEREEAMYNGGDEG